MNISTRSYPSVGQDVHHARLNNGLQVVLLQKPGYQRKYMTFSTHYGGMDSVFIPSGQKEAVTVPDGIAHFLEHKLFEEPEGGNVLDQYSRMGASPNAYTGSYYTVYLAALVDQFKEGFNLLLDYVQRPYFTDENVAKEQGIIEQEIQMGLDNPLRVAYYTLVESLFHVHPARIRTIGSVESIHQITKDLLYMCHDTFYHPSNMIVTVAGDITFDEVLDIVNNDMAGRDYDRRDPIGRPVPDEPLAVKEADVRHRLRVSRPFMLMGFKGMFDQKPDESSADYHRRLIAAELALEAVLGRAGSDYWRLYERGVIASRYSYNLTTYPGGSFMYVGGETEDPDAFRDELTDVLASARDKGVDADLFELARKRAIGQLMGVFDSPENLVGLYVTHAFHGLDILQRRELLDTVDISDGEAFLREFVQQGQRTVSVVEPAA